MRPSATQLQRGRHVAEPQKGQHTMRHHTTRSTHAGTRALAIAAGLALLTLAIGAGVASAGTHKAFHLDKTCADSSEPLGYICTVQHSDFKWIPAGTDVHYLSQDGNVVQAEIDIANGTTSGACTWSSDVDAVCVFSSGTGRLSQFNLEVVVTANADQSIWYWDGSYWFGN